MEWTSVKVLYTWTCEYCYLKHLHSDCYWYSALHKQRSSAKSIKIVYEILDSQNSIHVTNQLLDKIQLCSISEIYKHEAEDDQLIKTTFKHEVSEF